MTDSLKDTLVLRKVTAEDYGLLFDQFVSFNEEHRRFAICSMEHDASHYNIKYLLMTGGMPLVYTLNVEKAVIPEYVTRLTSQNDSPHDAIEEEVEVAKRIILYKTFKPWLDSVKDSLYVDD